jgi:hypothetical protein
VIGRAVLYDAPAEWAARRRLGTAFEPGRGPHAQVYAGRCARDAVTLLLKMFFDQKSKTRFS